jgi:hypothetical protein
MIRVLHEIVPNVVFFFISNKARIYKPKMVYHVRTSQENLTGTENSAERSD